MVIFMYSYTYQINLINRYFNYNNHNFFIENGL